MPKEIADAPPARRARPSCARNATTLCGTNYFELERGNFSSSILGVNIEIYSILKISQSAVRSLIRVLYCKGSIEAYQT